MPVIASVLAVPDVAIAANADLAPPASIRVCRSSGAVDDVPFKTYVKEVLPREFPTSWPTATVRAGAVAVMSFGWYYALHPYSSRCNITDSTRHQLYAPESSTNPPTEKTDKAVEHIWRIRMQDTGTGEPAFAQYCASCGSHSANAPNRYIDQNLARQWGAAGWTYRDILHESYKGMPVELTDWNDGFSIAFRGRQPHAVEAAIPFSAAALVGGVAVADPRAEGVLFAACTIDGSTAVHEISRAPVVEGDKGPQLTFPDADQVKDCAEQEFDLIAQLRINTYVADQVGVMAWRPWQSASTRSVSRLGFSDDPVLAAVEISKALFADQGAVAASGGSGTAGLLPPQPFAEGEAAAQDSRTSAAAAVITRADVFADALSATGLAGRSRPILMNPGGPDSTLDDAVAAEVERILRPGAVVFLIGGKKALSVAVGDALRGRGFEVIRLGGADRIETSLTVARWLRDNDGNVSEVLVARAFPDASAGWADAVAIGGFAAFRRHPVVLTNNDRFSDEVEAFVEAPGNGVNKVILLGGTSAIPGDAEQRLEVAEVRRAAGAARDGTAVVIADDLWAAVGVQAAGAMLVDAYDDADWPFALASAVYSARKKMPQLLVRQLVPRTTTGAWLDRHPGLPAVVVGGHGVVPARIDLDAAG